MNNTMDPAGKAPRLAVHGTPDNLALISARLKDSDQIKVTRRTRP
ncbi:hypothetical protein [Dechloromonas sp. A34]|nr:hypothetical protein [Dechloromonas sp. A34]